MIKKKHFPDAIDVFKNENGRYRYSITYNLGTEDQERMESTKTYYSPMGAWTGALISMKARAAGEINFIE